MRPVQVDGNKVFACERCVKYFAESEIDRRMHQAAPGDWHAVIELREHHDRGSAQDLHRQRGAVGT